VGAGGLDDRGHEVLEREIDERCALHGVDADRVEGDVDAPRRAEHVIGVALDGLLIVRIDRGCLGCSAGSGDLLHHDIELVEGAAGQEYLRPLASEGAGDRAPHRACCAVDDSVLVPQQHAHPPVSSRWSRPSAETHG